MALHKISSSLMIYVQEPNEIVTLINNDYKVLKTLSNITTQGTDTTVKAKINASFFVNNNTADRGQILGRYQGIKSDFSIVNEKPNQKPGKKFYTVVIDQNDVMHIGLYNAWDYENAKVGFSSPRILVYEGQDRDDMVSTEISCPTGANLYTYFGQLIDGRYFMAAASNRTPLVARRDLRNAGYNLKHMAQLDGGGSAQMNVNGAVVFDDGSQRPIPNALAFYTKNTPVPPVTPPVTEDTNDIKINKRLIGTEQYSTKCPHPMTPKYITIHNTANKASANNEYLYAFVNGGKSSSTGWHYAVDGKEIIQAIPDNRNSWHAGDGGSGKGNRESIGIEICYSTDYDSNRYYAAEDRTVKLVQFLMEKYSIPLKNVVQHHHWSGKDCPHRMRKEGRWQPFLNKISIEKPVEVSTVKIKTTKAGMSFRTEPAGATRIETNMPAGREFDYIDMPTTKYKNPGDLKEYQWIKIKRNDGIVGWIEYDTDYVMVFGPAQETIIKEVIVEKEVIKEVIVEVEVDNYKLADFPVYVRK